jgi:hypothetical protein
MTAGPQTSGRGPRLPSPPDPAPANHAFVPFTYGEQVICAEAVDGRCCGRSEDQHPAGSAAQVGGDPLQEDDGVRADRGDI